MDFDCSSVAQTHSVTLLIQQLKEKDVQAAAQIWRRYFERLLPLARAKLKSLSPRDVDEEDILVSVFDRFFRAAQEDRFARLHDRDDLWQILLMLTERKIADQYRKSLAQKRGGRKVVLECDLPKADRVQVGEVADQDPNPEFISAVNDNLAQAIRRLNDDKTREVALLRLEGYANREIADRLDVSLSSVERKLRVIRKVWQDEFSAPG